MQHFLAIPVLASSCAGAAADIADTLTFNGLTLNPNTYELTATATLEVSFFPPPAPSDPCSPGAVRGYLGVDNQLVRVTVASYNSATRTGTLLWGWNNASTLYRATILQQQNATATPPAPATLTLSSAPVDAVHTPQQGQVIEVLRTQYILGNAADQNYVSAAQGVAMTLPTTAPLVLPAASCMICPAIARDNGQYAQVDPSIRQWLTPNGLVADSTRNHVAETDSVTGHIGFEL